MDPSIVVESLFWTQQARHVKSSNQSKASNIGDDRRQDEEPAAEALKIRRPRACGYIIVVVIDISLTDGDTILSGPS